MEGVPVTSTSGAYTLVEFVDDLLERLTLNIASNAISIPIFQTFNLLLEADILSGLADASEGCERYGPSHFSTQSAFFAVLTPEYPDCKSSPLVLQEMLPNGKTLKG
jgi:hypothetical protein